MNPAMPCVLTGRPVAAAAATPPQHTAPPESGAPTPRERARDAAQGFGSARKAALSAQRVQGGPAGAVALCLDQAPRIAAQIGLRAGVALRLLRGMAVEPRCLARHGMSLQSITREVLRRLRTGAAATGFAAGDLRAAPRIETAAGRELEKTP